MGGEGCTPETLRNINNLLRGCGSPIGLTSGYGLSETFSVATLDYQVGVFDKDYSMPVVSVGYPFPGVRVGIFDEQGHELGYGQRGEIWVKTPAMTTGYLNNETATAQAFHGEWLRTADLGEMNEQGMLYVYGRMVNHIVAPGGEKVYLFDIANELRKDPAVKDCLVCTLHTDSQRPRLVAHLIVSDDNKEQDEQIIVRMDAAMKKWLPEGVRVEGYMLKQGSLKCNLVGKTDLDYYRHITDGYRLPVGGVLKTIRVKD
jgi:long-subunit acyl-CoA synthetase (AMP-forming)